MPQRDIAIIGASELKIVRRSGRSVYDLASEAFAEVLERTGIDKNEIDGMVTTAAMSGASNPFWSCTLADYLGLELDYCQTTDIGGSSASGSVARAAAAIRSGMCTTVLVVSADAQSTETNANQKGPRLEWIEPVGLMGPPGLFGLLTNRYDHQFGLKYEALAKIAVTQRNHALLNPLRCDTFNDPITEKDYLESRMISDPIRLLDCVMVCDGACALIVTSTEHAKELGAKKMVHPIGYGERTNYLETDPLPDITRSGHAAAATKALKQAGMTPKDIHIFEPYDDFIIAVMLQMEQIGFCKQGEGSDFVLSTDLSYKGTLPLNTGGGQISAGQAGLSGGCHNLVEGVRQLMDEGGDRQVANARNAMVTGIGWIPYVRNWGSSAVMILEPGA